MYDNSSGEDINQNPNLAHYNKMTQIIQLPQEYQKHFKEVLNTIHQQRVVSTGEGKNVNVRYYYDELESSIKIEYQSLIINSQIYISLYEQVTTLRVSNNSYDKEMTYLQLIEQIKKLS